MTVSTSFPPLAFGDLQGCRTQFQQLLAKAAPPADAPLWFAGDLINRVLVKGVVISSHINISIADVDLIAIDLKLLITGIATLASRPRGQS